MRGITAGIVVAGGALILPQTPLLVSAFHLALVDWTEIGSDVDLGGEPRGLAGAYLNSGRDAELMRVRSEEPLYWRGSTLDEFGGVRWSSTFSGETDSAADGEEIAPAVETETVRQSVEILGARTDLVFDGYNIQDVTLPYAEPASDGSWSIKAPLEEGETAALSRRFPNPRKRSSPEQAGTTRKRSSHAFYRCPATSRRRFRRPPRL